MAIEVVPQAAKPSGFRAWYFAHRGYIPIPLYASLAYWFAHHHGFVWEKWVPGLILVVAGVALRLASVRYLGRSARTRQEKAARLLTSGPYGWTRNPIYLATLLIVGGFGLFTDHVDYPSALVALIWIHYSIVVRCEEGKLLELYGEEYQSYLRRVPRWIPRPPRRESVDPTVPWREVWKREWKMAAGVGAGMAFAFAWQILF